MLTMAGFVIVTDFTPIPTLKTMDLNLQNSKVALQPCIPANTRNLRDSYLLDLGRQLLIEAKNGNAEAVKELVSSGAPFTADWVGTSPIHWTAHYNYIDLTELLLRSGISPDARNKVDRTPLHVASQNGNLEIVQMLLAFGADVNSRDMVRMTPLHWAVESGNKEVVKTLLEHGASLQPFNKFGKTPSEIAEDRGFYDLIKAIEEAKALSAGERTVRTSVKRKESLALGRRMKLIDGSENIPVSNGNNEILQMVAKRRKVGIVVTKDTENGGTKVHAIYNTPTKTSPVPTQQPSNNKIVHSDSAVEVLKNHGITMLEPDTGTVVSSAVEGGQTIKLTEAGKLALNSSKPTIINNPLLTMKSDTGLPKQPSNVVKTLPTGRKIITVSADQLISMTKQKKVVIKNTKPVPNARIFEGKLYSINQKDVLIQKVKEKRLETAASLERSRELLESLNERIQNIKKEAEGYEADLEKMDRLLESLTSKV